MNVADLPNDTAIYRIGGGAASNLTLKPAEAMLVPPGISTLAGGTAAEAAEAMRRKFPRMAPRGRTVVGCTTVEQVRRAGFDVIMNPTPNFPRHARLIHPDGANGFSQENLTKLSQGFVDQTGL